MGTEPTGAGGLRSGRARCRGKRRVCAVRITSSVLWCYLLQTQHVATHKGPHSVTGPKQKRAEGESSRGSEKVRKPAHSGRWPQRRSRCFSR